MRRWRPGSSQPSCHNQTDPLPKGRSLAGFRSDLLSPDENRFAPPPGRCGGERGTRVPAADQSKARDFPWAFGNRSLLFAKNRRLHRLGLPIEEIIKAGPGMDLGLANPAFETAGMLVRMLLSCRVVIHPATGAGEMFGGPYAACHPANMPRRPSVFQCGYPSQSN